MDMGKCHMNPPPKPEFRPEVPICLQSHRVNLPLLPTPQIPLIGKQSRPEHPSVSTSGEKMDMGKCHPNPPPKPEIRPEDPICLQPGRENLPLPTSQIHLIGKESRPEHPFASTTGEKVVAAIRKSLTRRQISQRSRRDRERAEATQHRPVIFSKRSMAQRARRDRQRQQAAIASSSTRSLPEEEQGNSTPEQSEKMVSQGSDLNILPPNKGVSSQTGSSIPAEHLKSVVCIDSPPRSSVSQGSILHILPLNKGVCSGLDSSIPAEHLTSAVFVNSPRRGLAGGSTASSVLSGPGPDNLISADASSAVNISSLEKLEVRLSSPSANMEFGKAFDIGSKVGSVPSQSLSSVPTRSCTAFPSSSPHGPASAASDTTKRTSETDGSSGARRITQARFNRVLLPQLAKPCEMVGLTNSNNNGKQWRPSGSSFEGPKSVGAATVVISSKGSKASLTQAQGNSALNRVQKTALQDSKLQILGDNNGVCTELGSSVQAEHIAYADIVKSPARNLSGGPTVSSFHSGQGPDTLTSVDASSPINVCTLKRAEVMRVSSPSANVGLGKGIGRSCKFESVTSQSLGRTHLSPGIAFPSPSSQRPTSAASDLVKKTSKKTEVMRASSPSANVGLVKGIDRSCKFESVTSQSLNRTHLSPGIAFPGLSCHGPSSAAPDLVKKTLGTYQSGIGGITQPLLSTLSNGISLPQLARSYETTGFTNSNSDCKQWRPGGSSFQDPSEVVQQKIDSTLDVFGAARSDKCSTVYSKEEPKKKALSNLKNDNLIVVPSSPGNSISKDRGTVTDATMLSSVDLSVNECPQSRIFSQFCHGENQHLVCTNKISEEELHRNNKKTGCAQQGHWEQPSPLRQIQTDESNEASVSSPHMKSLTEPLSALHDCANNSGVSHPGGFQKMDEQYWKARFLRLQDRLRQCDDTSDEEYIQRIQCSSSDISGKHVFELKGRALKLLLGEGYELLRVKHLNVLGSSVVPMTSNLRRSTE